MVFISQSFSAPAQRYNNFNYYYLIIIIIIIIIIIGVLFFQENPKGTRVIVGSMHMGYDITSDTTRTRTSSVFRLKRAPIPLGHSDGQLG